MPGASENNPGAANHKRLGRGIALVGIIAVAALVLLALLLAIAVSPVPMRGAEMFGALARKINGHPGTTTAIVLSAGAVLWLLLGILSLAQEWVSRRRAS